MAVEPFQEFMLFKLYDLEVLLSQSFVKKFICVDSLITWFERENSSPFFKSLLKPEYE